MKRIKQLLLVAAIGVLSFIALACSPEQLDQEQPTEETVEQGCECIKHFYNDISIVIDVEENYIQEDCESEGFYPYNILTYQNEQGVTIYYTITCE